MNWQADRHQTWQTICDRLRTVPQEKNLRVLVLAAHPDDETIGASLLLSRFPESSVAFLTDGAPRDTSLWSAGVNGSRDEYAQTRRQEAASALSFAGISGASIFWLGAVDQEAVFEIGELVRRVRKLLSERDAEIVVTHPYEGGHPDHDSAALVAKLATSALEPAPTLLEMTSYHARNGQCVSGEFLNSKSSPEFELELSGADRLRKRSMMKAYRSQGLVLENFPVDRERLRLAHEYDFAQAPHEGKLWYECMGWRMSGARWRELAAEAIEKMQERSCI